MILSKVVLVFSQALDWRESLQLAETKVEVAKKRRVFRPPIETIKYLTEQQVEAVLEVAKKHSTRDHTAMLLAYTHGLRVSEVGLLQLKWYDPNTRRIMIQRLKHGYRIQYLTSEECQKAMNKWLKIRGELTGPLFPSQQTKIGGKKAEDKDTPDTKGISKNQLELLFKRYATEAGVQEDRRHFHVLRHSCATHMVEKGVPLVQIKDWLGHRNISSTVIYASVTDMTRDKTAEMFFTKDKEERQKKEEKKERKEKGVQWGKDMPR